MKLWMVILDFGLPVNQSLGVIVNLSNWKTDLNNDEA